MPLVRSRPAHPADASRELLLQRAGQLRVPWQLGCLPGSQPVTALCWTAPTTRGRKSRVRVLFPPCVPRGSPDASCLLQTPCLPLSPRLGPRGPGPPSLEWAAPFTGSPASHVHSLTDLAPPRVTLTCRGLGVCTCDPTPLQNRLVSHIRVIAMLPTVPSCYYLYVLKETEAQRG